MMMKKLVMVRPMSWWWWLERDDPPRSLLLPNWIVSLSNRVRKEFVIEQVDGCRSEPRVEVTRDKCSLDCTHWGRSVMRCGV